MNERTVRMSCLPIRNSKDVMEEFNFSSCQCNKSATFFMKLQLNLVFFLNDSVQSEAFVWFCEENICTCWRSNSRLENSA